MKPTIEHPRPVLRAGFPVPILGLVALLGGCTATGAGRSLSLPASAALVVEVDARIPRGDYLRPPLGDDGHGGVILLRGVHGVTLDLNGVTLRGTPEGTDADENYGWGIVVVGCEDVTLRGGRIGGYRGCVVVRDSKRVTVEDMSFDGWFAQRLRSTTAAEDPADWLWPHDNDHDEWLGQYGAAISFTDCQEVTVRRCRGRHGQNGVLLTRTEDSEVYDNDFSFLSGWGLGMFRSSRNTISHNVFDYCVRGYSHGVYSRGQDSAGILMFERCCDNVVAFNSATHGGDGVFLYAGNDIVKGRARERGQDEVGGSDRNLFYGNDLRYSPANGLEATFSRGNRVIQNRLSGCAQHGIWGGYSSDMLVLRNEFEDTDGAGVTIEHGQGCVLAENTFRRNNMAVEFYWDSDPDLVNGPFGRYNDTDSRDHWLLSNVFEENAQEIVLRKTTGVTFFDNDWGDTGRLPYLDRLSAAEDPDLDVETVRGWMADLDGALPTGHVAETTLREWTGRTPGLLDEHDGASEPTVPGSQRVVAEERGASTGDRSTIVMGEWGPWDFRSGEPRPAERKPGGLLAAARWEASWFRWDREQSDPRADLERWRALAGDPLVTKTVGNWVHPFGDDDVRGAVGGDFFGLVATTTLVLEQDGMFELTVVSDDGVRVLVDGEVAFEDWTWHAPRRGDVRLDLAAGERTFTVEYFQIDGAAALSVHLERTD